jgi:small nuclear ribonucleoprotein (snRNP)-like protein
MANFNKPRFGSRPGGGSGGGSKSKNQSRPNNNRGPGGPGGPNRGPNRGKPSGKPRRPPSALPSRPTDPDDTGRESDYFKKLVDNEKAIVVVMSDGEKVRGTVRYYDREVFSLGPEDGSTKRFLRKTSIRYLYEE